MSHRRRLTKPRLAAALGISALLLTMACTGSTSATATADKAPRPHVAEASSKAGVTVRFLPGIIQPGKRTAASTAAKALVVGELGRSNKGASGTLESSADNVTWTKVATAKASDKGNLEFAISQPTSPTFYRVQSGGTTSAAVSSDSWLAPKFDDEFTGRKLQSKWAHRGTDYNPKGLRRCSKGSKKAVKLGGGTAQLMVTADKSKKKLCVAKRADGRVVGKYKYRLNGHIATQGHVDFTYGVAAARIKMQKAKGQHASFWLQPAQMSRGASSATTGGAEVDIIEWFGAGGRQPGLTSFIYAPTGKGKVKKVGGWLKNPEQYLASKSDDWYKGYHVFSVEWTKNAYVFRIDGQETWRTNKGISGVPQYAILSLLSSDYELKNLGGENKLPQKVNVDWVKVWEDPAP